ncbi:MAG: tetratricopeptide repeat protein [Qipengyuania sp.]
MSKQTNTSKGRLVGLAVTTALASATLAGCTAKVAPDANYSAAKASAAIEQGKVSQAVQHAEAAVLANPRDPYGRALLGSAYLQAGRFQSAAATLAEAIELGDRSQRTVISYALAEIAVGRPKFAVAMLDRNRDALDAADYGLAIALAGQPDRGANVLGKALKSGQNSAKMRQNLAYAYALQGDWRLARLMAEQDVPADKLGERMSEWARLASPEMYHLRVAELLGVPVSEDPGQPAMLALANHPSIDMLAAEAVTQDVAAETVAPTTPAFALAGELPAVQAAGDPMQDESSFVQVAIDDSGEAALADAGLANAGDRIRFVSNPVIQPVATHSPRSLAASDSTPSSRPAPREAGSAFLAASGDYRVQLGSYFSMSDAQAAWKIFQRRHPELKDAEKIISKAKVNGKIYYRVAAAGYAKASAQQLCSLVKKGGSGCLAYAASSPLPGTIDSNVRVAAR